VYFLGGTTATSSLFPTASTATTSTPFGFSTSRPATVPTFSFTSSTTAPAATAARKKHLEFSFDF